MTQPAAKVQEPSMEEILASIRRIIADDEAKPPVAEKPASPAAAKPEKPAAVLPPAKASAAKDIPPPAPAPAAKAPPEVKPAPPPPPAALAPAPVVSNSQDDIDALLNGLDEATTPEEIRPPLPDGEVFELTDEMALPEPSRSRSRRSRRSTRSNRRTISSLPKPSPPPGRHIGRPPSSRRRSRFPPHRPSRSCRIRPCPRSNPPSIRWRIQC